MVSPPPTNRIWYGLLLIRQQNKIETFNDFEIWIKVIKMGRFKGGFQYISLKRSSFKIRPSPGLEWAIPLDC